MLEHIEELGEEIDRIDVRVQVLCQHARRGTRAAADIGDTEPAFAFQSGQRHGEPGLLVAARPLARAVPMQVNDESQIVQAMCPVCIGLPPLFPIFDSVCLPGWQACWIPRILQRHSGRTLARIKQKEQPCNSE